MPHLLETLLTWAAAKTGFSFTILGGGPCPEQGGAIEMFA